VLIAFPQLSLWLPSLMRWPAARRPVRYRFQRRRRKRKTKDAEDFLW